MPSRHRSRQRALQVLYQIEFAKDTLSEALDNFYNSLHSTESGADDLTPAPRCAHDEFMETLVRGAMAEAPRIDEMIGAHSEHWRLERMPAVDRNILRLAVFEMTRTGTPPPVVIDEALELARRFSGEASVAFINGVLDAVRKQALPPDSLADAEGGENPV